MVLITAGGSIAVEMGRPTINNVCAGERPTKGRPLRRGVQLPGARTGLEGTRGLVLLLE